MSFTIVQLREEVALKVRYRMQESVGEFVEEYHEEFGLTKKFFSTISFKCQGWKEN